MPHIHTEPDQHDMTVSAYIVRKIGEEWYGLVHLHRKLGVYMQAGGHIELHETPWQTVAHEVEEETGYALRELTVLQPGKAPGVISGAVTHPLPILVNTHTAGPGPHYHSDLCYAFVADALPKHAAAEGESTAFKWLSLEELRSSDPQELLMDVAEIYDFIISECLPTYEQVKAETFSLEKPNDFFGFTEKKSEALTIVRFGNPILRKKAQKLTEAMIRSEEIQSLIEAMNRTVASDSYGVGLAAPQVGKSLALSVIGIKPTPTRPNLQPFNTVIINPSFEGIGELSDKWEGCISCGTGNDTLYAKVPRYTKIHATWLDEKATKHERELEGFVAHVFQHETDHVNGVLFVDRVKDSSTYMMGDEYRKRIVKKDKS